MYTGAFHKLHNSRNKYILSVANGIHFHFLATDIFIHQNWFVHIDFNGIFQIMPHVFFLCHDFHGPAPKNEAGAHKNGVTDFLCGLYAVFNICYGLSLGLWNIKGKQKLFK